MKYLLALVLLPASTGCMAQKFTQAAYEQGVSVAYRWKYPVDSPPELLLKLVNAADSARSVHVVLDLYRDGLALERFTADTCITAKRSMSGKFNGFWCVAGGLDPGQVAGSEVHLDLIEFNVQRREGCK